MLSLTLIAVGNLKESYLREAFSEYQKRLSAFCSFRLVEIKESRLPDDPSPSEIASALSAEAKQILPLIPPRSYRVALCVEGKQLSSPELADLLDRAGTTSGSVTFLIGSSFGLSDEVKNACDLRLSFSRLTFPHQLMRVITAETLYRSLSILHGSKYHK